MEIQQKIDVNSLIARYKPELYWHLQRTTSLSKHEIEETVMDTFMKAVRAYSQYDEKYAFSTWLYRIANNSATDRMRKNNAKKTIRTQPLDDLCFDSYNKVEYNYGEKNLMSEVQRYEKKLVRKAVKELTYPYRKMIVLRYFFGFDYDMIADSLDCPLGTVKGNINRAKAKLKIKLENVRIKS